MSEDPVYLDHNATTPLLPEVVDAMLPYLREHFGNPSSEHVYGLRARTAVARAREQVAKLIGCDFDELVFTSGGTEASNLAILGVTDGATDRDHIVTTLIEHPATQLPCDLLEARGKRVSRIDVDGDGCVRMDEARASVTEQTALVTVMHSNNETGALQPIRELADAAHRYGALLHTDAAQSIGKVPVRVRELDVDLLTIAGHKLYAPKGVGALFVRRGVSLAPLIVGADHERGLRAGTENVASIVGLGQACEILSEDMVHVSGQMRCLRNALWEMLSAEIPGLVLNGHFDLRLPNTLNIRFPGVLGAEVLAHAPEIAASTGSACHAGQHSASKVILAMGVTPQDALGSVRLSLGRSTTEVDIVHAARALIASWRKLAAW